MSINAARTLVAGIGTGTWPAPDWALQMSFEPVDVPHTAVSAGDRGSRSGGSGRSDRSQPSRAGSTPQRDRNCKRAGLSMTSQQLQIVDRFHLELGPPSARSRLATHPTQLARRPAGRMHQCPGGQE